MKTSQLKLLTRFLVGSLEPGMLDLSSRLSIRWSLRTVSFKLKFEIRQDLVSVQMARSRIAE